MGHFSDKHCDVESVKDQFPVVHISNGDVRPGDIVRYVEKSKGMTKEELVSLMRELHSDYFKEWKEFRQNQDLAIVKVLEGLIDRAEGRV